ncbi:MAG: helix-turn-helix domain-containing protein [Acidobacteria bacterium]|nr:helix-turn-helix domain-containing protein [Acidobacteriota bacterium]
MTADIEDRDYAELLARTLPHVLKSADEYDVVLERVRQLIVAGDGRSEAEDKLLDLLVALVEKYEAERFEIPRAEPCEVLALLIENRGLRPADLAEVLGSRGHVSDILSGRRRISADKARAMGEYFGVDPGVFL